MIRRQQMRHIDVVAKFLLLALLLPGNGLYAQHALDRGDDHGGCQPVQQRSPLDESSQLSAERIAALKDAAVGAAGYGSQLNPSAYGWVTLPVTCLWIEPVDDAGDPVQNRWQNAVLQAVKGWETELPIAFTPDQGNAHVVVLRREPPRLRTASGLRARNGMARLSFEAVQRNHDHEPKLEPRIVVLVDPGLREALIVATAGHELGHAFGLWGHSLDPGDQMAVSSGAEPVQVPSPEDRTTLQWLRSQPSAMGTTVGSQDADTAGPT